MVIKFRGQNVKLLKTEEIGSYTRQNRIEIWKDIGYTGRQCQKQQQMESGGNTSNIKSLEVLFWFQDEYIFISLFLFLVIDLDRFRGGNYINLC
jgi:hypothetical protein